MTRTFLTIDPFTSDHAALLAAVLESFEDRANLTPRQKAAWGKCSTEELGAIILLEQRMEGVAPADRKAVLQAAHAEGVIKLVGNGAMAHYALANQ